MQKLELCADEQHDGRRFRPIAGSAQPTSSSGVDLGGVRGMTRRAAVDRAVRPDRLERQIGAACSAVARQYSRFLGSM
jgi:hypothetical protein